MLQGLLISTILIIYALECAHEGTGLGFFCEVPLKFQNDTIIQNPILWHGDFARFYCPASRTTLVATRFRVAVICPIIQVPHCIRVFFYFVWFVFINHIFQFYYELCTYCNILDIYLS